MTEFDLLKAIKEGKELWKVKAGEIMTKGAISVAQDTPAMEIIQLLQSKHLIRVAVVDAEGKLVGVVSRRDILYRLPQSDQADMEVLIILNNPT